MSVELIGEKKFIEAVSRNDGVWVLMQGKNLFVSRVDAGNHLPVWLDIEAATSFAETNDMVGMKPIFVPLSIFCSKWLAPGDLQIVEVGASPKQGRPTLTFSSEELLCKIQH